jgi:ABC-2 type transport system permease protein
VTGDILTVASKEWRELLLVGGGMRGGRLSLVIMLGMFGVFLPSQFGPEWLESPSTLFYWGWLPLMIVSGTVADSFAGERERRTLETLLASRLPDRAIVLGKFAAAVSYGWGLVLCMLVLGVATINVTEPAGAPVFLPWRAAAAVALVSLLGTSIAAGVGILVSLRSPTVRQASQTLSVAILLLLLGPVLGVQALPAAWKVQLVVWVKTLGTEGLFWTAVALLAAGAAVLLLAAMARFKRFRLILD